MMQCLIANVTTVINNVTIEIEFDTICIRHVVIRKGLCFDADVRALIRKRTLLPLHVLCIYDSALFSRISTELRDIILE